MFYGRPGFARQFKGVTALSDPCGIQKRTHSRQAGVADQFFIQLDNS
jgi:hypothetical protein